MTATSLPPMPPDPSGDLVSISVSGAGGAVRAAIRGEIDSSSAPSVRAALDAALAEGARELTVDLADVTFLDSAGLCVLAAVHRQARHFGVRLRVLASDRAVVRPLEITGLYHVLGVEPADRARQGSHSAA